MKATRFMSNARIANGEMTLAISGRDFVVKFSPDQNGHDFEMKVSVSAVLETIASLGQYKDQNVLQVMRDILEKRGLL